MAPADELEVPQLSQLLSVLVLQSTVFIAIAWGVRGTQSLRTEFVWHFEFFYLIPLLTLVLMLSSAGVVLVFQRLYEAVVGMFALLSALQSGSIGFRYSKFLLIALLSGFAEELLFRGVLQYYWGIVPASILFGLMHIPGRDFWPYGLWAGCMGLIFGGIYLWQGNLLLCTAIHALNNFLALCLWPWIHTVYSHYYRVEE